MIEPKKVKEAAEKVRDENYDLRTVLKMQDYDEVDRIVHEIYDEIYDQKFCDDCKNCCKELYAETDNDEEEGFAEKLGLSISELREKYYNDKKEGYIKKNGGCSFFINNECILEDVKPESCKEYPYLHKKEFGARTLNLIDQTEVCPMVYEVFERLKQYEWEEPDYSDFLEQFYALHKGFDTNETNVIQAVSRKIGRNEPCPCGSGKKYKKCCGK